MAVYVGPLREVKRSKRWHWPKACHMVADTSDELDEMAEQIGLDQRYKQDPLTYREHFDLNGSYRERAMICGARSVDERKIAEVIEKKRTTHGHA